jgi:hypothetical protein
VAGAVGVVGWAVVDIGKAVERDWVIGLRDQAIRLGELAQVWL